MLDAMGRLDCDAVWQFSVAIVGSLLGLMLWAIFSWRPVLAALVHSSSSGDRKWVGKVKSGWQVFARNKTLITIIIAAYQVIERVADVFEVDTVFRQWEVKQGAQQVEVRCGQGIISIHYTLKSRTRTHYRSTTCADKVVFFLLISGCLLNSEQILATFYLIYAVRQLLHTIQCFDMPLSCCCRSPSHRAMLRSVLTWL